jgi:microcin C transport system substrate-binding protein
MIIKKKSGGRMSNPLNKSRFHWFSDFNYSRLKLDFNLRLGLPIAALLATGAIMSQAVAAEAGGVAAEAGGGFAVYGTPKYPPGFSHFDYVNPNAPKGCTWREAPAVRSNGFDSLNPFILRGRYDMGAYHYLYDTLMQESADEIDAVYPRLARSMTMSDDGRAVTFVLDPRASWHDGRPVTTADVTHTIGLLSAHGRPSFRAVWKQVTATAADELTIRFDLPEEHPRRIAVEISQLRVLPKHYWETREFDRTSFEPPLGSGPYRIADVKPGRAVTYERVPDYWGRDLPALRGRYNFDRIVSEYYFNETAQFEAFLKGHLDVHVETDPRRWQTGYDVPAVADGRIRKADLRNWFVIGMNGFFFNLRQPRFADVRVRKALDLLFDFEWVQRNIFHESYSRTASYFENSRFAAHDAPTVEEIALMRRHERLFPTEAYERAWRPTTSDGSGFDRNKTRDALALLKEAGWELHDGRMVEVSSGKLMSFVVTAQTRNQEKLLSRYFEQLRRLGIRAELKIVDGATYEHQLATGEFDIIYRFIIPPQWPGREQRRAWSSYDATRSTPNGRSVTGLADSDIDALAERVIAAKTLDELTVAARVLDRALQWGYFAIPGYFDSHRRVAHWSHLVRPAEPPKYSWGTDYWWCSEAAKDKRAE